MKLDALFHLWFFLIFSITDYGECPCVGEVTRNLKLTSLTNQLLPSPSPKGCKLLTGFLMNGRFSAENSNSPSIFSFEHILGILYLYRCFSSVIIPMYMVINVSLCLL